MHIAKCMSKSACQPRLKLNSSNFHTFLIKNNWGCGKKCLQFIEAIYVSIKTCITSLVAKKSSQPRAQGHKFHPYGPSQDDSVCKQTSTTISYLGFLNLSKSTVSSMKRSVYYFKFAKGAPRVFFAMNLF